MSLAPAPPPQPALHPMAISRAPFEGTTRPFPKCLSQAAIAHMAHALTFVRSLPRLATHPRSLPFRHTAIMKPEEHRPSPGLSPHTRIPILPTRKVLLISPSTTQLLLPAWHLPLCRLPPHQPSPLPPTTRPARDCRRSSSWLGMHRLARSMLRTSPSALYNTHRPPRMRPRGRKRT